MSPFFHLREVDAKIHKTEAGINEFKNKLNICIASKSKTSENRGKWLERRFSDKILALCKVLCKCMSRQSLFLVQYYSFSK